jgi:hypothetical protein
LSGLLLRSFVAIYFVGRTGLINASVLRRKFLFAAGHAGIWLIFLTSVSNFLLRWEVSDPAHLGLLTGVFVFILSGMITGTSLGRRLLSETRNLLASELGSSRQPPPASDPL